jgi:hypothetical protein
VSERLEAYLESNFTDAQVLIEQQQPGPFDANCRNITAERRASDLPEKLAEIKFTDVQRTRGVRKGQVGGVMPLDVGLGALNYRWFTIAHLNGGLVAHQLEMFGENLHQLRRRQRMSAFRLQ